MKFEMKKIIVGTFLSIKICNVKGIRKITYFSISRKLFKHSYQKSTFKHRVERIYVMFTHQEQVKYLGS